METDPHITFLKGQMESIEAQAKESSYPEIRYPRLVHVDETADDWAKEVILFKPDQDVKAEWVGGQPHTDMPAVNGDQLIRPVVGFCTYGCEFASIELVDAQRTGENLSPEKAINDRRRAERILDKIVTVGIMEHRWTGLFNNPSVPTVSARMNNGDTPKKWIDKTADEILEDIVNGLGEVWTASERRPNTVLIPPKAYSRLCSLPLPGSSEAALKFIQCNNIYTAESDQPLTIRSDPALETAGLGKVGRMVIYLNDPSVVKLHLPMRYRFTEPQMKSANVYQVPGIMRTGGLEIRCPSAFRYVDGI